MYQYLLFDLDGTLTDSQEGITKCVQYALHSFGVEEPDLEKLKPFIGPPLIDSFVEYYGWTRDQAKAGTQKYRERFEIRGMFENRVYEGIPKTLEMLRQHGKHLVIASSKPEKYVKTILEHFDLGKYFSEVVGASMDEQRNSKAEVIREAFCRLGISEEKKSQALMIGDRRHDVEGAKLCGIDCLGVYYGFADPGELEKAGARYIVHTVAEMEELLLTI